MQIFYRAGNNWFYYDFINVRLGDSHFEDTLSIRCSPQVSDFKKQAKEKKNNFSNYTFLYSKIKNLKKIFLSGPLV